MQFVWRIDLTCCTIVGCHVQMFIKCFRIQFTPQTLDDRHTPGSVCSVVFDEEHLSINSSTGGVSINRHV